MKLMSEAGYAPSIDLWEQQGTVMGDIRSIDFYKTNDKGNREPNSFIAINKVFTMNYTQFAGISAVLEAAEDGTYFCPSNQVSILIPKLVYQYERQISTAEVTLARVKRGCNRFIESIKYLNAHALWKGCWYCRCHKQQIQAVVMKLTNGVAILSA